MRYTFHYLSPLGGVLLAADGEGLTGLWFDGQNYFAQGLDADHEERRLPVFEQTVRWLDLYFSGREPAFMPPLHLIGSPFQVTVWRALLEIPYGHTTTYAALAKTAAARRGAARMSARAVGGAVGRNRISVLVPCHRVVGTDGSLTGYAGGLERKARLLALEKAGAGADRKEIEKNS